MANSGNNRTSSSTPPIKSWNPCFNFAKGTRQFGESCRYVHDLNARLGTNNNGSSRGRGNSDNNTNELSQKLLQQLASMSCTVPTPHSSNNAPVAFNMGQPTSFGRTTGPILVTPRGFSQPAHHSTAKPLTSGPSAASSLAQQQVHVNSFHPAQQLDTQTLRDLNNGAWNMDTGASSHLNSSVTSLNIVFNTYMYLSISVGDGHSIPVTNTGHSILSTPTKSIHLNNVLITPHIVKNLIYVCQIVRDNNCTVEFDAFGFSVKDFLTRRVLLRCNSTGDLYPVTAPSPIPHAFLVSQHTWHQRLGHPGVKCCLGKHVRLPFVSSNTVISSCFDIIHSDVWTSPIPSLSVNPNPDSVHPMVTSFHVGTNRPTKCLNLHMSLVSPLPKSYRDAFNDPNWQNGMRDEYTALIKNKTWTLVPRPPDTNIVRCMWLFHYKYLADGTLSRYKARLVANGSTQLEGVDVDETFSLVAKLGTIRTVLSLAASRHWSIHQLDVKNAFLHGDLSETVYMHHPSGFRDSAHPDYVCLLQRSLYGLKQAPQAWGIDTAYLLLYVDDIVLTASSEGLLQRIIGSLHQEFAMTDLGPLNYFLGISVKRDSSGLFLSQKKYAIKILEKAHMVSYNPSQTPVDTESKLGDDGDPVSDLTLYRSLAGSLQYLTFTRPDISYAGTLNYGLQLFSSSTTDLVAYSDADWAGCPTTRRSTSGYCVFLGNNLLSWSAKRQPTLSRSSAEAEYRGVANAVAETCWLRNLLRELHTPLSSATLVYCDNVSAVYLSSNPVQHQRTKHIEIDIHFVRDLVAAGQVRVLHVPSRYQYADIFTKGLPSALFEEFRTSLSVRCPPAPTAGEC
ncbi:ribonuclease H-like domain-containing protein [Tanacetum coccineum]